MGLYGEAIIATKPDSTDCQPDNIGWTIYAQLIMLPFYFILFWLSGTFIVYVTWDYIGLTIPIAIIIGLWCVCRRLGTDSSMFDRPLHYQTLTTEQCEKIKRRLATKV